MTYEQACELYFQWAKIEAGDPDVEPMVPNQQISTEVGGTWYLANVCGPLATVSDNKDTDCAVEHPITGDGKWNDITNAIKGQAIDAIDRVAKRFGYDAQSMALIKQLVHAGRTVIVDEDEGVIICPVQKENAGEDTGKRLWKSGPHSDDNRGSVSHTPSAHERHRFLETNTERLVDSIKRSGIADPVGVVADLRDFQGRQLALWSGISEANIDAEVQDARTQGQVATLGLVISWKDALEIMPNTSPTASQHLKKSRKMCRRSNGTLLIAIMGGGNSYAIVNIPKPEVPDGSHQFKPQTPMRP